MTDRLDQILSSATPGHPVVGIDGLDFDIPATKYIDWAEFFTKDRSEPEWLYEPVLARGRGHSLFAKGGSRKSLFALWMAVQVAAAGNVVIYCDYEMSEDDLYERLVDMGCTSPDGLLMLRYYLLPSLPPLNTEAGARAMVDIVEQARVDYPQAHIAVIIDTISRAVVGEENSNDTIQEFYRHTGLALKQREVTYLRLDHAGHGDKQHARGGSAKAEDIDVAWALSQEDGNALKFTATKRRMGWVPEEVYFDQVDEPVLGFKERPPTWPKGTEEKADQLDRIGAPLDVSTRKARRLLEEAGITPGGGALLGKALKFRRLRHDRMRGLGVAVFKENEDGLEEL